MINQDPPGTYRYHATTVDGLIQQLSLYLSKGYWFYVSGKIPKGKDARRVAEKLIAKYDVMASKYVRVRRKRKGYYNTQFILHDEFWWLLATQGTHPKDEPMNPYRGGFFRAEHPKDARRIPIKAFGYSLSMSQGVKVRIEREQFAVIRDWMLEHANKRPKSWHEYQIRKLPFQPYGPVRKQLEKIVVQLNALRRRAGKERLRKTCIRYKIERVRPFD